MKENHLSNVLFSLNMKEWKALDKYLRSPFFNQRKDVLLLFNVLREHFKSKSKTGLDEKNIYSNVFEGSYDNIRFNHCKSQLLQLIYGFLSYQEQQKEPFEKEVMLGKALQNHKLNTVFTSFWKRQQKKLKHYPYRNAVYFKQLHELYLEQGNFARQEKRTVDIGLENITDAFSIHFIAKILRYGCALLSQEAMNSESIEFPLLTITLEMLEKGHYLEEPVVQVYYYSYLSLKESETSENFVILQNLLQTKAHFFPKTEIRDIYLLAINYCIKKLNQGEKSFIQRAFDFYRSALEGGILLENGFLSHFTYNNILILGLNLKKIEWTETFLNKWKSYLPERERENTFRYNLAIFYFRTHKYEKVMDLLQSVRFKEVLYNLDARRMLLRIYYERKEWDALDSLLDTFRAYLYRQQNIGYHRTNYLNLVKLVRKMISGGVHDSESRKKLRKEIDRTQALVEKDWLLEQLV